MRLSQSRGLIRVDAEIGAESVRYRRGSVLSSSEVMIPLEEIGDEPIRFFHVSRISLLVCVFFAATLSLRVFRYVSGDPVSLASVVWASVLFIVPVLGTWMSSPRWIGLPTDRGSMLFLDRTGAQDPRPFMDEVHRARHARLASRARRFHEASQPRDMGTSSGVH